MSQRVIRCTWCGTVIGCQTVFSHAHDDEDTGDAEHNELYGGEVDGDAYCVYCFQEAVLETEAEEVRMEAITGLDDSYKEAAV